MALTQNEKILAYMQENGSITPLEALSEFGCMRLASRICELKNEGVKIKKTMITSKNRYGETVNFAKYELEE